MIENYSWFGIRGQRRIERVGKRWKRKVRIIGEKKEREGSNQGVDVPAPRSGAGTIDLIIRT